MEYEPCVGELVAGMLVVGNWRTSLAWWYLEDEPCVVVIGMLVFGGRALGGRSW